MAKHHSGLPRWAIWGIFVTVLLAYAIQVELAQVIQRDYNHPIFLLYLTHSGYIFIFPIQLIAVTVTGGNARGLVEELLKTLKEQFGPRAAESEDAKSWISRWVNLGQWDIMPERVRPAKWVRRLLFDAFKATLLISIPSGSWYMSAPLSNMTDITAIYNTFAFWAYLFSVWLLGEKLTTMKTVATVLAMVGVVTISYGDAILRLLSSHGDGDASATGKRSSFEGNFLALIGSVSFAFFEVWYKRNIALPGEQGSLTEAMEAISHGDAEAGRGMYEEAGRGAYGEAGRGTYEEARQFEIWDEEDDQEGSEGHEGGDLERGEGHGREGHGEQHPGAYAEDDVELREDAPFTRTHETRVHFAPGTAGQESDVEETAAEETRAQPRSEGRKASRSGVFLAHSNFFASLIGVITLLLLWFPLPILNAVRTEDFTLPTGGQALWIAACVSAGVVFEGGFMLLISLWGPVVASVGNLCTLLLVGVADFFIVGGSLGPGTLVGGSLTFIAFVVLMRAEK